MRDVITAQIGAEHGNEILAAALLVTHRCRLAVHSEVAGHRFLPQSRQRGRNAAPQSSVLRRPIYVNAALTRAALSGRSRIRLPVALAKALTTAAAAGPCEASPAPRGRSFGRLISSTSTVGASAMVRIGKLSQSRGRIPLRSKRPSSFNVQLTDWTIPPSI